MAAVEHWTFEQTTDQTHTGDTSWTTVGTIDDSTFTPGATYLILYSGQLGGSSNSMQAGARLAYGATPTEITETRAELEPSATGATARLNWAGHTVWTAGSGEDLVVQIRTDDSGATVRLDSIYLAGIRLDAGGLVYEDDADATQTTHTTSFVNRASVTVSAAGTENWLVLASFRVRTETVTQQMQARINRDGDTEVEPAVSYELEDSGTDEFTVQLMPRVYTLSAGDHTFALQTRDAASAANVYESSRVTAVKLTDQFPDHGFFWDASSMNLNTTGFVNEAGNVDITPSVSQDAVILGFATVDLNSGGSSFFSRLQVGGTTEPTGSDTNTGNLSNDIINDTDIPTVRLTVENLGASAQDIDFDLSPGAVSGFTARYRSLLVWGLEFVPTAPDEEFIVPVPLVLTLAPVAPVVSVGAVAVSPAPLAITLASVAPSVTQAAGINPAPAGLTLAVVAPSVVVGAVSIAPAPLVITLSVVAPSVAVGAVQVAPAPAGLTLTAVAPSVSVGAVQIAPDPVVVTLSPVAPSVARFTPPAITISLRAGETETLSLRTGEAAIASLRLGESGSVSLRQSETASISLRTGEMGSVSLRTGEAASVSLNVGE